MNTATFTNTPTSTATQTPTATHTPSTTPTGTPGGCDFSIAPGDVYGPQGLVAAINQANADRDRDVICLAPGAYALNLVQAANTGLPIITSPIEIQGSGAALIRDAGAPQFRVFQVAVGGQLILDSLSITGGLLTGADGGAIFNDGGTLVVVSSLLTGNSARSGGAVYNNNGAVSIADSDILANSAPTASGGGILNIGLNSVLIVSDSQISNNSATSGGGIYNSNGFVSVANSVVSDNSATSAAGMFNSNFGVIEMTSSVMAGNTSVVFGGAVAAEGAAITINNSCITNNASPLGSGIVNLNSDPGTPPINAEFDWWGAPDGPGGEGGGSGDAISGNIDYIPFLTEPLPFCPPTEAALMTLTRALLGF